MEQLIERLNARIEKIKQIWSDLLQENIDDHLASHLQGYLEALLWVKYILKELKKGEKK